MGKLINEIKKPITLDQLSGKVIAIDAYNTIYQFLSIIRQPDGTPLMDSKNRVTSHLSGIFYRTLNLIENNIQPIYVFDGIPSTLKQRTISARIKKREEALEAWNKAKEEGMIESARTYAMASTRINKDIVESSKELLGYMGIPFIQAPGEGEAQGAAMTKTGIAYGSASQDYDSFLFGAVNVIRNLTISGRRKLPRKNVFINVEPELSMTEDLLRKLDLNQLQLVMLGALVGTDFNTGIEKVGPKTALKLVKENPTIRKLENAVKEKYNFEFDVPLEEIVDVFIKPDIKNINKEEFDILLKNFKPDSEKLLKFLSEEHEFSEERISSGIKKLLDSRNLGNQKGINSWM
ncbi:MAG: flap endonuclease-1 [Candidatus Micrarchaeaceae archaeon]